MKDAAIEGKEKLDYVKSQITEMTKITWRNDVDIYINENSVWSEDEKPEVDAQIRLLKKTNEKLAKALLALGKLETILKK